MTCMANNSTVRTGLYHIVLITSFGIRMINHANKQDHNSNDQTGAARP